MYKEKMPRSALPLAPGIRPAYAARMDTAPAGMVDIYHSLLVCGAWVVLLGLHGLKAERLKMAAGAIFIVLILAGWFWPLHLHLPHRLGKPVETGLDFLLVALVLGFLVTAARRAGKTPPPAGG